MFLEEPVDPPAPFGEQVQLRCRVLKKYKIEWGIRLSDQFELLASTDQPQVLDTFKKIGIAVKRPNNTTSFLVINANNINIAAITCIAVDIEDHTIKYGSKEVKVNFGKIFLQLLVCMAGIT